MKTKKIPMRTCAVTHEKFPKKELIRIVRTPNGEIIVDKTGKLNGRGAYLKIDKEIFKKAKDKKILDKILEVEVKDNIYEELDLLIK